jgi:hypothetical protein
MTKTKDKTKPPEVIIGEGDKVCVEYEEGPCMGIVSSVSDGKCIIGFDDGTEDTVDLAAVKLISKAGQEATGDDVTKPATKSKAASPNAQQLEKKADVLRRNRVDSANKEAADKRATIDAEKAGKPLTAEEKVFMARVGPKMNGRKFRRGDNEVVSARQTSFPSSAEITRYARLRRQRGG